MTDFDDDDYDGEEFGPDESEFGPVDHRKEIGLEDLDIDQFTILSYLRSNHDLWIRCAAILKEEYFDEPLRPVLTFIRDFETKNHRLPSKLIVHSECGVQLDLVEDANEHSIVEFICEKVEEFCRYQAGVEFLIESAAIISKDKSRGTMANLVTEMGKLAAISVQQDLGYSVHHDAELLLRIAEKSDGLPTYLPWLDECLNGGVTDPSLNIVSAASGQGKSIFLQNLAVNYVRNGYNVVYISLELPEFMLEKRFAAMMTGTDIRDLYKNFGNVVRTMQRNAAKEGDLRIKRMSITSTTLADIRSYILQLEAATGLKYNRIMIDYMDLMMAMKPGIRADNIHLKDKAVAEELYEWTHEPGSTKIVWTASQQTKGAKDEKDARQSAVAGGVGKVHTCDNLLILKRSREDKQDEVCWCHIEKGRNGGQGSRIPIRWLDSTQRMTNDPELEGLYIEANTPGYSDDSEKKKNKISNDPIAQTATGERQSESTMTKIRERMRGKV